MNLFNKAGRALMVILGSCYSKKYSRFVFEDEYQDDEIDMYYYGIPDV